MAEAAGAIAALGLASNILQFVDFGSRLTVRLYGSYRSSRNGEDLAPDLESLTANLREIVNDLREDGEDEGQVSTGLQTLLKECHEVGTRLLDTLRSLRPKTGDGKVASMKNALKRLSKDNEIERLQERLQQFRNQLILHLVWELRVMSRASEQEQRNIQRRLDKRLEELRLTLGGSPKDDESIGPRAIGLVVSKLESEHRASQMNSLKQEVLASLMETNGNTDLDEANEILVSNDRVLKWMNRILTWLHYPSIDDREDRIAEAHIKTFQWVLSTKDKHNTKWANLAQWLESDHQLYWITGKAGSGKSTLMKYICGPDTNTQRKIMRCHKMLLAWSQKAMAPTQLITARYFFWNSGTQIQRSQSGLLRSLLYQIFSSAPFLIPKAASGIWDAIKLFDIEKYGPWTDAELIQILTAAVEHLDDHMRLCFFVDGLDEFNGDHSILISLFQSLIKNPKIKVCISSRPWEVFETAFRQTPSLRMEVLTHDDIKSYTSMEFQTSPDFELLQRREAEFASKLIYNIVKKADGVFLWVHLVTVSLLSGMRYGDRIADLQERLDALPPELDNLYDKMLDSLDPFYYEHVAQLFTLVETAFDPIEVILLSFIDEESSESAVKRPIHPLTEVERADRFETVRRRLNSRTKGLLEIPRNSPVFDPKKSNTVQYLHRTVHDFILSDKVQSRLQKALRSSFDCHLWICTGIVAYLKVTEPDNEFFGPASHLWNSVTQFMYSASRVKKRNRHRLVDLMDSLDGTCASLARKMAAEKASDVNKRLYRNGQWVALHPANDEVGSQMFAVHFHSLAVRYGVTSYIAARIGEPCIIELKKEYNITKAKLNSWLGSKGTTVEYPLIADIVIPWNDCFCAEWHLTQPSISTVECLLRKRARFAISSGVLVPRYDPAIQIVSRLLDRDRDTSDLPTLSSETAELWQQLVKLLIEQHDNIWSTKLTSVLDSEDKDAYYYKIFGQLSSHFHIYSLRRMMRSGLVQLISALMSLEIHDGRLELLNALQKKIQSALIAWEKAHEYTGFKQRNDFATFFKYHDASKA